MPVRICARCGHTITGRYLQALGQSWHISCFTCTKCGKHIGEYAFKVKAGKPYHPRCYQEQFARRCDVCGDFILGRYIENFWGDIYCAHHRDNRAICYACQRPISQRLTKGGSQYEDGRAICSLCRATAVDRPQAADSIMSQVQDRMARYGLDTHSINVPLQLVSVDWMSQGGIDIASARTKGRAETTISSKNGVETERRIRAVSVLWGLPQEMFEGVLAHELGHVWLFKQHMNDIPEDLEEGLCNLFAYILHQEKVTPEARYSVYLLEENLDPVYGEGFRRSRAIYHRKGLRWLLHFVRRKGKWPQGASR